MKIAAVEAIAELARMEASEVVAAAYGGAAPVFGPDYIIPKPFDPRLILEIAPAVARAAMASGVARRPIADFDAYKRELERFVFRSGQLMRPVFEAARKPPRSASSMPRARTSGCCAPCRPLVDDADRPADPARPARGDRGQGARPGAALDLGGAVRVIDPGDDSEVFAPLVPDYQRLAGRRGVPPDVAARGLRGRATVAAAMLLHAGEADAAICRRHRRTGGGRCNTCCRSSRAARRSAASMRCRRLILPTGTLFICDTHMVVDPTAEQIAEMTLLAAEAVRGFGIVPKVALLSHSNFGASEFRFGAQDAPARWR